jgi:hypothetical protein
MPVRRFGKTLPQARHSGRDAAALAAIQAAVSDLVTLDQQTAFRLIAAANGLEDMRDN